MATSSYDFIEQCLNFFSSSTAGINQRGANCKQYLVVGLFSVTLCNFCSTSCLHLFRENETGGDIFLRNILYFFSEIGG